MAETKQREEHPDDGTEKEEQVNAEEVKTAEELRAEIEKLRKEVSFWRKKTRRHTRMECPDCLRFTKLCHECDLCGKSSCCGKVKNKNWMCLQCQVKLLNL